MSEKQTQKPTEDQIDRFAEALANAEKSHLQSPLYQQRLQMLKKMHGEPLDEPTKSSSSKN